MKLYIKDPKLDGNLSDFLNDFLDNQPYSYSDMVCFRKTYYDEDCKEQQCHEARRSLLELFNVCKTYYPDVTLKEVAIEISKIEYLFCRFCDDVEKWVFYKSQDLYYKYISNVHTKDSIHYTRYSRKGCDGQSYDDYLELLK